MAARRGRGDVASVVQDWPSNDFAALRPSCMYVALYYMYRISPKEPAVPAAGSKVCR